MPLALQNAANGTTPTVWVQPPRADQLRENVTVHPGPLNVYPGTVGNAAATYLPPESTVVDFQRFYTDFPLRNVSGWQILLLGSVKAKLQTRCVFVH
jgi:hypothetical protein